MQDKQFKQLLSIFLIKRLASCENSYGLNKILSWRFDIIDIKDIINSLTSDGLVSYTLNNGIEHFQILPKGFNLIISSSLIALRTELNSRYPEQKEFIYDIFKGEL